MYACRLSCIWNLAGARGEISVSPVWVPHELAAPRPFSFGAAAWSKAARCATNASVWKSRAVAGVTETWDGRLCTSSSHYDPASARRGPAPRVAVASSAAHNAACGKLLPRFRRSPAQAAPRRPPRAARRLGACGAHCAGPRLLSGNALPGTGLRKLNELWMKPKEVSQALSASALSDLWRGGARKKGAERPGVSLSDSTNALSHKKLPNQSALCTAKQHCQ